MPIDSAHRVRPGTLRSSWDNPENYSESEYIDNPRERRNEIRGDPNIFETWQSSSRIRTGSLPDYDWVGVQLEKTFNNLIRIQSSWIRRALLTAILIELQSFCCLLYLLEKSKELSLTWIFVIEGCNRTQNTPKVPKRASFLFSRQWT